jgi:hypothetical protein
MLRKVQKYQKGSILKNQLASDMKIMDANSILEEGTTRVDCQAAFGVDGDRVCHVGMDMFPISPPDE